jgi:hypothetical protein
MYQDFWGSYTQTCVDSLAYTGNELHANVKNKLDGIHENITADL